MNPKFTDPETIIDAVLDACELSQESVILPTLIQATFYHPKNARLWQMLGVVYRTLQQSEEAIAAFTKASLYAPNDIKPAYGVAQASLEAGLPSTALFDHARLIAPSDGSLLIGRAAAQFAEGNAQNAIADLSEILENNPFWMDGHITIARLIWAIGDNNDFTRSIERSLRNHSNHIALWEQYIVLTMQAHHYENALEIIALARHSLNQPEAFTLQEAICASEAHNPSLADSGFKKMGAITDPIIVERYVRHLLRTGRIQEAAQCAEPFLHTEWATLLYPYILISWRLLNDPRWLEVASSPSQLGIYDIEDKIEIEPLKALLSTIHAKSGIPFGQSVRGGTQTDGPLFARIEPEITALKSVISNIVATHIENLPVNFPLPHNITPKFLEKKFKFSGSWSVRLLHSGYHSNHIHFAGHISSALYLSLPVANKESATHEGWLAIGQPPIELGLGLDPVQVIEPKPGRLVLFPSTMWHGTIPFHTGERLTVAFDVVSTG